MNKLGEFSMYFLKNQWIKNYIKSKLDYLFVPRYLAVNISRPSQRSEQAVSVAASGYSHSSHRCRLFCKSTFPPDDSSIKSTCSDMMR